MTVCNLDISTRLSYSDTMTNNFDQDAFYSALGQRIRERRIERGITQSQLAQLLSLSRTSVTNIESGRQKLLVHTLIQIASVLNMEVSTLLPDINAPEKTNINKTLLQELSEVDRRFVTQIVSFGSEEGIA